MGQRCAKAKLSISPFLLHKGWSIDTVLDDGIEERVNGSFFSGQLLAFLIGASLLFLLFPSSCWECNWEPVLDQFSSTDDQEDEKKNLKEPGH